MPTHSPVVMRGCATLIAKFINSFLIWQLFLAKETLFWVELVQVLEL